MGRLVSPGSTPIRPADASRRPRSTGSRPISTTASSTSITRFNPHVLVHIGVWEPDARASPKVARHAHRPGGHLDHRRGRRMPRARDTSIVRSGIEIYGRGRDALTRPDETAPIRPTSDWGRTVAEIEHIASRVAEPGRRERRCRAPRTGARTARAVAARPHAAHARSCRSSVLADPPFAVIKDRDAARAIVAAAREGLAEPVNVVASGAITCLQAIRRGRRVPFPLDRARLAGRPDDELPVRLADPRSRRRDAPPWATRRQRSDGRAARRRTRIDDVRGRSTGSTAGRASSVNRRDGRWPHEHRSARRDGTRAGVPAAVSSTSRPEVVDDWGRDPGLVPSVGRSAQLRWNVTVGGDQHLPRRKGALVVVNARRFALAPIFAAFAISEAVDRPVRFVGRSDTAPLGPLGSSDRRPARSSRRGVRCARGPASSSSLGAEATHRPAPGRHVGRIKHELVGAATAAGVQVFPAATMSSPFGRSARVEIGQATRPSRRRRGPLAELELADHLRDAIVATARRDGRDPHRNTARLAAAERSGRSS